MAFGSTLGVHHGGPVMGKLWSPLGAHKVETIVTVGCMLGAHHWVLTMVAVACTS